jgi:hypothetical protein
MTNKMFVTSVLFKKLIIMLDKKHLLLSFLTAGLAWTASAQPARLQVIHNCADAAADSVDVYVNGSKLLDNFAFRTATPFINAPTGSVSIAIAPKNSTSVANAIYTVTPTLTPGQTYVAIAQGIVSSSGYTPAPQFQVNLYAMGKESAANGTTEVLVAHGSTDAPDVDVRSGTTVLVNDIAYGQFSSGYLALPTDDYTLEITNTGGTTTVASYAAPLQTLSMSGKAIVVVASGFLNPAANSNGPAFGLYAAPDTGGVLIRLPLSPRLQAIHNCADAAADSVDVYVNGDKLLDNFAFRTATPFVNAPYGPVTLQVAPKNSTSAANAIYTLNATLTPDETYVAIAEGIVSATGYTPAQPFKLNVFATAREKATAGTNTDLLVYHGCTDAPVVDIRVGNNVLVNDIAFGNYDNGYLNLPTSDYTINVTDASGATVVASYSAPLQTLGLQGQALTVLASGFLNRANNSNGPAFGLFAASAQGGALTALPQTSTSVKSLSAGTTARVYPNPAKNLLYLDGIQPGSDVSIIDFTGKLVQSGKAQKAMDIEHLQPGLYLLRYQAGDAVQSVKFVKE